MVISIQKSLICNDKTHYHLHHTDYDGVYDFKRLYIEHILKQNKNKEFNVLIESIRVHFTTALDQNILLTKSYFNLHFVNRIVLHNRL